MSDVTPAVKEYVDTRSEEILRLLDARFDGLNAKIDGAVVGLNAKMDGLRSEFAGLRAEFAGHAAKMDAVLLLVNSLYRAVEKLSGDVDLLKDMLAPREPIGFRKPPPA